MSKRATAASRRDDRLAFFPLPVGSAYEQRFFIQEDIADYARRRGREAARETHKQKLRDKTKAAKRAA